MKTKSYYPLFCRTLIAANSVPPLDGRLVLFKLWQPELRVAHPDRAANTDLATARPARFVSESVSVTRQDELGHFHLIALHGALVSIAPVARRCEKSQSQDLSMKASNYLRTSQVKSMTSQ